MKLRIDIGANSIRSDLALNKSNVDTFELKNRGENVRGRVIDVNQNIVLVQTSSGKEFVANTVIPMENFIGEEMSFVVVVGSEGQILLKPELDEKKQSLLHELKIEDILNKLNKAVTPENRQIIKNMIQSGIAINENSFKEIKSLTLAMNILQKLPGEDFSGEKLKLPLDMLVKDEDQNGEIPDTAKNTALPKEVSLKDIITLKGLKLEVNLQNLKALHEINKALASKDTDIFGLKKMMGDHFGIELETAIEENKAQPQIPFSDKQPVIDPKTGIPFEKSELSDENAISLKSMNPKSDSEEGFKGLKDLLSAKLELSGEQKISKEMIKELLTEITKASSREIPDKIGRNLKERVLESDLKLDIERLSKDLKTVLNNISKESEIGRSIEREVLPKADILKEFMREFNVNILPFQVEQYENIAQYYVKKNKNKQKSEDGITVAFSLDTFHHGNVRALLNYQSPKVISVDILAENEKFEQQFKLALGQLRDTLKSLGYTNISLSTGRITDPLKSIAEDKIYPNFEAKSFETWV